MPIIQLMILALIISAFAVFIIVLLSVSLYVSAGKKEEPTATALTPARRPIMTHTENQVAARQLDDGLSFG